MPDPTESIKPPCMSSLRVGCGGFKVLQVRANSWNIKTYRPGMESAHYGLARLGSGHEAARVEGKPANPLKPYVFCHTSYSYSEPRGQNQDRQRRAPVHRRPSAVWHPAQRMSGFGIQISIQGVLKAKGHLNALPSIP